MRRNKTAIAIVPASKFAVTRLDVAELRLYQLQLHVVIVNVPERVAVDRQRRVFADAVLVMQVLDPSVDLVARQPVLLFELRPVATGNDSADAKLNPIVVLGRVLRCCSGRLSAARFAGLQLETDR